MEQSINMTLDEGIAYLIEQRRIITGIGVSYGNAACAETFCRGRAREVLPKDGAFISAPLELTADSLYDLASVTKLFTCLAVLLLEQAGKLRLTDPLSRFDKRFKHIGDVSVEALLSFHAALSTPERVDAQTDAEQAKRALFDMRKTIPHERRFYTDMGAMTLKYVIEAAADLPFYDYLKASVLEPLGMKNTFCRIPRERLQDVVDCNCERRVLDGRFVVDTDCPAGVPHDPKARVLSREGEDLCGHAGLFSTVGDMTLLAQGLLNNALLPRKTLLEIGVDRTGRRFPDGSYSQHMGYLCYAKHPVQTYSEVPACFSERTIALNGFTGNHFSVDPLQNRFMILLANRVHDRVTVLTGRAQPNDDVKTLLWDDGKTYPVSQNFVYMKDRCLKNPVGRLLEAF